MHFLLLFSVLILNSLDTSFLHPQFLALIFHGIVSMRCMTDDIASLDSLLYVQTHERARRSLIVGLSIGEIKI